MKEQLIWNYEKDFIEIEKGEIMTSWFIYSDYIKKSDRLSFTIEVNDILKKYDCPYELKGGKFVVRRYQNNKSYFADF